jgi:hypothetical protein
MCDGTRGRVGATIYFSKPNLGVRRITHINRALRDITALDRTPVYTSPAHHHTQSSSHNQRRRWWWRRRRWWCAHRHVHAASRRWPSRRRRRVRANAARGVLCAAIQQIEEPLPPVVESPPPDLELSVATPPSASAHASAPPFAGPQPGVCVEPFCERRCGPPTAHQEPKARREEAVETAPQGRVQAPRLPRVAPRRRRLLQLEEVSRR